MYMYIAGQFTQAMLRRPFHSLEGAVMGNFTKKKIHFQTFSTILFSV